MLFRKNYKVTYCIGTIRISFIQEWIERRQRFTNICTGPISEMPSLRKWLIDANIDLRLITCEDNIVILPILQKYVLHWYHTYLLHPGMDRTEAIICQHFYWPVIRESAPKEVRNCDTLQNTKLWNKNMVNYQLRNLRKYHEIKSV